MKKELGLEGFDFLTDRYHDRVHEGVTGKVLPWVQRRKTVIRSTSTSRPGNKGDSRRRTSSMPRDDFRDYSRHSDYSDDYSDSRRTRYDNYRGTRGERPPTLVRDKSRGPPPVAPEPPQIKEPRDISPSHIYPPPPIAMIPPYPTTAGAVIAMPPDDQYPSDRTRSFDDRLKTPRHDHRRRARSQGYHDDESDYDDYWEDRDEHHRRRRRSRSRSRSRDRRSFLPGDKHHLAASVAGAVAGGFIGRETGKGNWKATAAGAVLGALGANAAERTWEAHKRKDRHDEEAWEYKWGRK